MQIVIAQLIGFVGAGFLVASFQCKTSRKLILFQLLSNAGNILHFLLLGAYSGCFSICCGLARCIVLYKHEQKWAQWKGWLPFFVLANLAGAALTWESWFSVFPAIAMVSTTIGSWSRNGRMIRLANTFLASPAWLVYDFHTHSIPGALCELFCLGSIGISFLRYGWRALDGTGDEKHGFGERIEDKADRV